MRPILVLAFGLLAACGGASVADRRQEAQAALDAGDYAKAVEVADATLKDPATAREATEAWRLEQLRLDALARSGRGAEVLATLQRLAGSHAAQVNAAVYHASADKLRAAGDGKGAVDVLDAGFKRFPDDTSFKAAIDEMSNSADPAEIERLKALGYL